MARFEDYHRTVIGYHGTSLSSALRIINRIESFRRSERDFDWLGRGIYFWEYAPRQALAWATLRREQLRKKRKQTSEDKRRAEEPIAVIASMIRLGFCFDLLEPANIEYLGRVFDEYSQDMSLSGQPLPKNNRKYRRLDYAVFEYAYNTIEESPGGPSVDTARGVYVPPGGGQRVWGASWVSRNAHIQLCVRNPICILGTWLHHPTTLGADDVKASL